MSGSITADRQDELKARVRELKKKPMNCAIGDVGKLAEIRLHPTRQPTALLAELRNDEPKVVKPACGLAFVPGEKPDEVRLDLRTKPAGGICKRVAKRLKGTGLRKVVLLVMGEVVDSFHDEEAEAAGQEQGEPSRAVPDADALMRRLKAAGESMRGVPASNAHGREARVLLGEAIGALRGEQLAEAVELTRRFEEQVAAALSTAAAQGGLEPAGAVAGLASGQPAARQPAPAGSEGFAAALRGAQDDLKAARAIDGQPESDQRLVQLVQDMTAARAASDWARAEALAKQARSVAVRMLSAEQVRAAQTATYDRMAPVFAKVERTYFTDASVSALAQADVKPGKEFQAFIAKQYAFMNKPSIAGCDAIAEAADAYLAHRKSDLNRLQRSGKDSQAKKTAAESAKVGARHMKMALELKAIGAPPWDEATAMRVQELCAAFNFETTFGFGEERAGKKASPLGDAGGVSASFWVTGHEVGSGDEAAPAKQFLFKPAKGEQSIDGFPRGGSAPREAISKALADAVMATTGLDLGVPDTAVVSIAPAAIELETYNKAQKNSDKQLPTDRPIAGSMQHFVESRGQLSEALAADPDFLDSLPVEECHRASILDILTLNCDRHPGNFMVTKGPIPALVPIDHGLTFPSDDGLEKIFPQKMNNPCENVLLCMGGNFQPFSEETAQRLEMLDPDAMAAATQASRACIDQAHPELGAEALVPDDSVRNARRAALFLKRACRRLSPAMIQVVLGTERAAIFGGTDEDFEQAAGEVIAQYEGRAPAIAELFRLKFDTNDFRKRLRRNGWHDFATNTENLTAYRAWVYANPQRALDAYVSGGRPPAGYVMPLAPPDRN